MPQFMSKEISLCFTTCCFKKYQVTESETMRSKQRTIGKFRSTLLPALEKNIFYG